MSDEALERMQPSGQPTVLVTDDREENRYTLRHALTRAGFQVVEARSGKEALTLSKMMPDVIVLDVRLPDILGYEVCRRIKSNPLTSHIPVLELSAAFLSTESKLYALESGADAYLIQPVDPLVLVATVRSLIRLHQAEKQAHAAAREWAATFDALAEGVAIVVDDAVQRCNRAMTELLGTSYGQIEGRSFRALLADTFAATEALLTEAPFLSVRLENRFFRISLTALPGDATIAGSIFLVADVTPQKQAETALLLNERLAATGRIAHTIAHEINNPLEAITNLIYLAQSSDLPEETRGFLATAANEVDRVSQIARQILSFHREASTPIRVPIAELVEDVLALSARAVADKRLVTHTEADSSLVVMGFPARLRQAFSNFIRNAIEASAPEASVRVHVSRSSLRRDLEMVPAVRITIADNGVGIPPELRGRIFEAFFTTKQDEGSGVGLWLASTIIEEHKGKLQLRSRVGDGRAGTCVSVLLPAAEDVGAGI